MAAHFEKFPPKVTEYISQWVSEVQNLLACAYGRTGKIYVSGGNFWKIFFSFEGKSFPWRKHFSLGGHFLKIFLSYGEIFHFSGRFCTSGESALLNRMLVVNFCTGSSCNWIQELCQVCFFSTVTAKISCCNETELLNLLFDDTPDHTVIKGRDNFAPISDFVPML